nr:DUF5717 family protein [Acetatifactor sp.]
MQEIIEQILAGDFVYENSSLDFSCSKLELTLPAGTSYEGSFRIQAAPGTLTNGYINTTDLRMECLLPRFSGGDEEIPFCFHGESAEEGQVVKGAFNVVSNHGEYYLPFVVSIEHRILESSIGTIKNLFHFANLAKSNWQEAVNLFYSSDFEVLFRGVDEKVFDSYRGLSAIPGNQQNVEEFLIQINKKQRVEFLLEESELTLELLQQDSPDRPYELVLNITRNGWGYTTLCVECDGEFAYTEKQVITDDDFLGNRCRLPVYIDGSVCRNGKNIGQLVLYNSYEYITVPIVVKVGENIRGVKSDIARKRLTVQLMDFYQAFRLKQISSSTWRKETAKLVDRFVAMDERDIAARLFQAQLLISEERYNEAEWLLEHGIDLIEKNHAEDDALRAYYLYLLTLIHREEGYVNHMAKEVEQIYQRNPYQWRVAWLLLYLSEEYNKSASGKWMFLEKQFYYGCTSPVLYIEALYLLRNNPALLRRLDTYEIQLLYYGARQQALGTEVIEQLIYLSGREREFSSVLLKTLELLYEQQPDTRILQEICTLLIKGGKADPQYFEWFRLGVEAQLRITNLYEYYMMSINQNVSLQIPKIVLMYFSYQSNLDYERAAYLYAYVLKNKDSMQDLFERYQPWMERFVLEQIRKLHINRNLALLYQTFLKPEMLDEELACALCKILYAHQISVQDERLRKVIVYRPGYAEADEYMLTGCTTWVPLYGSEYTILFEDAFGNRFIKNVEYTLEKTMVPGRMVRWLFDYDCKCPQFDLHLCSVEQSEPTPDNIGRMRRVLSDAFVCDDIKKDIALKLLKYFYDNDDMQALDEHLENMPFEELSMEERTETLKYMVLRGKYVTAYQWVNIYGPYFADVKTLVRLVTEMIHYKNMEEDHMLTAAAMYSFRKGKYSETILEYLAKYYNGLAKDMRDIWKAARSFDVDCYQLSERLLIQMLYSHAFVGEKMDIFQYYISQGAKQEVEEAFLEQCSFDFFVREKMMEAHVFRQIRYAWQRGEETKLICRLAYLKYFAENQDELKEEDYPAVETFIKEFMRQGIHFEFLKQYKNFHELVKELDDRTIIEYRAKPGNRAVIHYVTVHDNGESDEYFLEPMREVYGGVCFKEFVLFFGECLQYYITEESNGEERLTESGSLQKSDIVGAADNNRYSVV